MNNKKWLLAGLAFIALFITSDLVLDYDLCRKKQFIVYNVYNTSLTQVIEGKNNIIFSSITPKTNIKGIKSAITNPHIKYRQKSTNIYLHNAPENQNEINENWDTYNIMGNTFINVNSKKILLLYNDSLYNSSVDHKLSVDKIVISNAVNISGNELLKIFDTNCLIIDSSVPKDKAIKIMEQFNKKGIQCHYAGQNAYIDEI